VSQEKKQGLSPVAAHCLKLVKGWLGVVLRGKGGELRDGVPYTRLKATEVQEQLEREVEVVVSSKTVQRALTELVVGGYLSRRQLYKHTYNRTYWYAPGELEQKLEKHRPRSVAARYQRGPASVPTTGTASRSRKVTGDPSTLKAQVTNSTLKTASSQTAEQTQTGETPCGPPEPRQEVVTRAWGKGRPTVPAPHTGAHSGRLQKAQQRLAETVQRATGFKGFGSRQQGPSSKAVQPATYRAECAQAAGFLR